MMWHVLIWFKWRESIGNERGRGGSFLPKLLRIGVHVAWLRQTPTWGEWHAWRHFVWRHLVWRHFVWRHFVCVQPMPYSSINVNEARFMQFEWGDEATFLQAGGSLASLITCLLHAVWHHNSLSSHLENVISSEIVSIRFGWLWGDWAFVICTMNCTGGQWNITQICNVLCKGRSGTPFARLCNDGVPVDTNLLELIGIEWGLALALYRIWMKYGYYRQEARLITRYPAWIQKSVPNKTYLSHWGN